MFLCLMCQLISSRIDVVIPRVKLIVKRYMIGLVVKLLDEVQSEKVADYAELEDKKRSYSVREDMSMPDLSFKH